MRSLHATILVIALIGCSTALRADQPLTEGGETCGAERLSGLIGQPVGQLEAVSARPVTLRVIRPGDPITEDYSETRLNADLDSAGVIVRLWCG